MRSTWKSEEDALLRSLYGTVPSREVAAQLGRGVRATRYRANQLGLTISYWTPEEDAELVRLFGRKETRAVAHVLGRSYWGTYCRARRLGLTKKRTA